MKHFVSNSKQFFWKNKAAFYASAFPIVIKFSIVCRKLSEEEKQQNERERKKLQGERIVITKNMHIQKKCKFSRKKN